MCLEPEVEPKQQGQQDPEDQTGYFQQFYPTGFYSQGAEGFSPEFTEIHPRMK